MIHRLLRWLRKQFVGPATPPASVHSRILYVPIERIDLGAGDWVDLKTVITYGDRAAIQQKLFGFGVLPESEIPIPDAFHMRAGNLELLLRSIVAWGGPGFCFMPEHPHDGDCIPRPVTIENLEHLDETAERILLEIRARQLRGSPDFTRPPSPTTSTAGRVAVTANASEISRSSS